jgi:hypothetical protein
MFWNKHAKARSLINSVRAYHERAIRFFGAVAVLAEDEGEFFRTLEARTILLTPNRDLLNKMNQTPKQVLKESVWLSQAEIKVIKKEAFFKPKDVAELKRKARQHLLSIKGG